MGAAQVPGRATDSTAASVDVFLPSCGEPLAMLENTFTHVAALRWSGELTVYCLDDSARPEVERLADRFGFVYLSRPNRDELKKAATCGSATAQNLVDHPVETPPPKRSSRQRAATRRHRAQYGSRLRCTGRFPSEAQKLRKLA